MTIIKNSNYEEEISIRYYSDDDDKNDNVLDIEVIKYEIDKIINIWKKSFNNESILSESSIYIVFKEGSFDIRIKFNAIIRRLYFDIDDNEIIESSIRESLSSRYDSFLTGVKLIKWRKLIKSKYNLNKFYFKGSTMINVMYEDKTIWEGEEVIFKLIQEYISKGPLLKNIKYSTKALNNHDKLEIKTIDSKIDEKSMMEKFNKKIDHKLDIKEMIIESKNEIELINETKLDKEIFKEYKMNIVKESHLNSPLEKKEITVIPFADLNAKKIKINLGNEYKKPNMGNKNYMKADVEVEYEKNEIKSIKILKIINFEINKEEYNHDDPLDIILNN